MDNLQFRHRCDSCGRFIAQNDPHARYFEQHQLDELGHLETEETLMCAHCLSIKTTVPPSPSKAH